MRRTHAQNGLVEEVDLGRFGGDSMGGSRTVRAAHTDCAGGGGDAALWFRSAAEPANPMASGEAAECDRLRKGVRAVANADAH